MGGDEILKFVNVEENDVVDVAALGRDCTGGALNIVGIILDGAAAFVVAVVVPEAL